jgi:hypothetical protein
MRRDKKKKEFELAKQQELARIQVGRPAGPCRRGRREGGRRGVGRRGCGLGQRG